MSKQTAYAELLRHPKWQKRRLEVLSKHDFACDQCGDTESTLHVHHGCYVKGKMPWQYPDVVLHVLCKECHECVQQQMNEAKMMLGLLFSDDDIRAVADFIVELYEERNEIRSKTS